MTRLDRLQVFREASDRDEARRPPSGMNVLRQGRPLDGQRRRDDRAPGLLEMSEESRQQLPGSLQLESERPSNFEVVN
jgi:hypothetical protein